MRWVLLAAVLAVGCDKKDGPPAGDPKGGPAAFDPEDVDKTLRWVANRHAKAQEQVRPNNSISANNADDEFRAAMEGMKGKAVRWRFAVLYVGKSSVEFFPAEFSEPRPAGVEPHFAHPHYSLELNHLAPLAGFDWARIARKDVLIISGTVSEVRVITGISLRGGVNLQEVRVRVVLADPTVATP